MTDIVKRLRGNLPMEHDGEGMIVDEDAVFDTFKSAADEIERLKDALKGIAKLKISPEDSVNKYIVFMARSMARAAIGVKIDE